MNTPIFHLRPLILSAWLAALPWLAILTPRLTLAQSPLPDEFNPRADSAVSSLAVQADGKILVGGDFSWLGGQKRARIARLNANGTLDDGFNPGANGYLGVRAFAVQADGTIVVGGVFTTLGGQTRNYIGRLNADGTLDNTFNPGANNAVNALALQADGKILVGGSFTTLGGESRDRIGRLNTDGTLDSTFNPGANSAVNAFALQADGRILMGGFFTVLGGESRARIARLNADGSLDGEFNPGASGGYGCLYSLAVQTDGKILVGGGFTTLGGQPRTNIVRLNADGTLDNGFNLGAGSLYSYVSSLAVQVDGKILVGGDFTTLGGRARRYIARLNNSAPAAQNLMRDGSTITWLRGGTSPEVWRTAFEGSTNGVDWVALGEGVRIEGGWQLTDLNFPTNSTIRVRGYATGGWAGGSSWLVESVHPQEPPWIIADESSFGNSTNGFGFDFTGSAGSTVVVEGSTNLVDWLPLQTSVLGSGPLHFTDPGATNFPASFYRVRLAP